MTPDYASLDAAIVKAIRDGSNTLLKIEIALIEYGWRLEGAGWIDVRKPLQSLRKRGIVEYKNGRWSAVEKAK